MTATLSTIRLGLLAVCAGVSFVAVPAMAQAQPGTAAISTMFRDFCLTAQPSLPSMEHQAAAFGGSKQSDKVIPTGAGRSLHQETWLVRRDTGIYQLTAMEGDAASGPYRAVGCGLTAGDADGVELAQALAMGGLGAPSRRLDASGGKGASVVWSKAFGANSGRVVLSYGGALTGGASVHLILPKLPLSGPPPSGSPSFGPPSFGLAPHP
jgi:hypothetical protein